MENDQKDTKSTEKPTAEQPTINDHDKTVFEDMILTALKCGGIHLTANKNFGKSFMLFSITETLQKLENVRCIAFDGSEAWIYKASKIPVYTIGEHDILSNQLNSIEEFEKYSLKNEQLIILALETHKDILFRFKTKKPSKRAFLIRYVTQYLDAKQRKERDRSPTHEIKQCIALILDESQDAFSNRASLRLENEEFMCIFAEARNSKISFISSSQRLTDLSKAIRAKQLKVLGKLDAEDITPALRRIEKAHNLDFANMKERTWFFEGKTFISPTFKQNGKPYIINAQIKQAWLKIQPKQPKPLSLREKITKWLNPIGYSIKERKNEPLCQTSNSFLNEESIENSELEENLSEEERDLREIEEEWIE